MAAALRIAIFVGAAFAALVALPASAQFKCDEPTKSEWLTRGLRWDEKAPAIPASRIFEIAPATVGEAVRALENVPVLLLDADRAVKFLGAGHSMPEADLSPFLVRAVYPTASLYLSATLLNGVLRISAGGMGCAPFLNHPVVIYLEHAPVTIEVSADATL